MEYTFFEKTGDLNKALFNVTHGLYILTSKDGDKINGQCLDALMQVTNVPPKVAIGVGKKTFTHEMIDKSGVFNVNILEREDKSKMDKVKCFGFQSGRDVDKFSQVEFQLGANGVPIVDGTKVYYECEVIPELTQDLGTHTLYVGLVKKAGVSGESDPLTYNEYRKSKMKGV